MKQHREFQFVYRKSKGTHSDSVVLFHLKKEGVKKIGFTATKKIGNAVVRNRSKRRLRSLFVKNSPSLQDGFYVFVAKATTSQIPAKNLQNDFEKVLSRAKCFT
ncbi:MAG: ribonuclease P protein component [Thiovulaceae bacterium]|nr:ribonuclease P protein component [Sulfurimonadaceae bacterium]